MNFKGKHIIQLYKGLQEFENILLNEIHKSKSYNQTILLFSDKNKDIFFQQINNNIIKQYYEENHFFILDFHQFYFSKNYFDIEFLKDFFISQNKQYKLNNIKIINDINILTNNEFNELNLIQIGINLTNLVKNEDCEILCLYDIKKIPYSQIIRAFQNHTHIIIDNKLYENNFFCNIDKCQIKKFEKALIESWIENIKKDKLLQHNLIEKENKFKYLVTNANSLIIEFDKDGNVIFINEYALNILKIKENNLKNNEILNYIFQKIIVSLYFKIEHKELKEIEIPYNNNEKKYIQFQSKIIVDENNQIKEIISIGIDITEKKIIEQKLEKERENLKILFNSAPVGMILFDDDFNIVLINLSIKKMFYYSKDYMNKRCGYLLCCIHLNDNKKGCGYSEYCNECNLYQSLLEAKEKKTSIYEREFKSEIIIEEKKIINYFKFNIEPIIIEESEFYIVSLDNITNYKKVLEDLEISKQISDKANKAKSIFLTNISHELRTPLNAIIGFSQILVEELNSNINNKNDFIEYAKYIEESGKHLLDMVNDILDLSKIESGKIEINKKSIDIYNYLNNITLTIKSLASNKNISIELDIEKDIGYLNCDEIRLKQILYNLLSNAIKFTNENKKIGIIAKKDNGNLKIIVWDQGIGIPEQFIEKIFEPFEQVKDQRFINIKGTGLGLSITKKLVNLLNGSISVESHENIGTRFTIILPERYDKIDNNYVDNLLPVLDNSKNNLKKNVLIVEDVLINMKLIEKYLEGLNLNIFKATNGKEAINLIDNKNFDIILLDINLPDISGIEVFNDIKKSKNKNSIIFAITANTMKGDKEKYLTLGFNEYLPKPLDRKIFNETIIKYLN